MQFHEKLDFLMKVLNIPNSVLGRELSFDASYISRIRNGKRGIPKNQPFISPVASYAVRCIKEDYQKRALTEAICPAGAWPENDIEARAVIEGWLSEKFTGSEPVARLLTGLSTLNPSGTSFSDIPVPSVNDAENNHGFYYGNEGKRRAVEIFLSRLCNSEKPYELHLYSSEDMSWLSEDTAFAKRWAALLIRFIKNGGHISIIHTIRRDISEMLEGVQKWLPLYIAGAIDSYYYPKLRDNVYRRTLFIAKDDSAIFSTSVGNDTSGKLNILTFDSEAARALDSEFTDYFSLCRPLMRVFQAKNADLFWSTLAGFNKSPGDMITAQPCLSQFSMPDEVVNSISKRCSTSFFSDCHYKAESDFRKNTADGFRYVNIINLPDSEDVKNGKIPLLLSDFYGQQDLFYTCEEYLLHLGNVIRLLKENPDYNVIIMDRLPPDLLIFVKEDRGAFVARLSHPSAIFCLEEPRMIAALWEYASNIACRKTDREKTVRRLETFAEEIKSL